MIVEPVSIKAIRCSHSGGVSDNNDSRYYGIPTDKGGKALEKKIIRIGQASNEESQAGVVISRGGVALRYVLALTATQ